MRPETQDAVVFLDNFLSHSNRPLTKGSDEICETWMSELEECDQWHYNLQLVNFISSPFRNPVV